MSLVRSADCYHFSLMCDKKYRVVVSPEAEADMIKIHDYIAYELLAPETAVRYHMGMYDTIQKLSAYADIFAMSGNEFIRRRYGVDACTIRYKKMTIVYNIIGDVVYIRRVMASSLIL